MDSVYAVTTLSPAFLSINVTNTCTDTIRGPTIRRDHSNTSIHNNLNTDILNWQLSRQYFVTNMAIILHCYYLLLGEWVTGE